MQSNVMCFLFNVILLLFTSAVIKADDEKDVLNEANNLTVHNVTNQLLTLFDIHYDNERFKELNKKLERINQYVVDNNLVADVLTNLTMETNLNETNFYKALNENDHFSFLNANETKNLYLKLKEKMTRDDIIKVAAERGKRSKLVMSARRMMEHDRPTHQDDEKMSDVVDEILAEAPIDQHQVIAKESMVWDPQNELDEMKAYYDSKASGRRIYKGERTGIKRYPFMASVQLMGKFWCGAVLLGADYAITSASCLQLIHNNRFFRENPRVLQLRVGSDYSSAGGELIDVLEVYFHPSYNPKTLNCNLALMRLRRHLFFGKKSSIKYLTMQLRGGVPTTSKVLLLGWGLTKLGEKARILPVNLQRKILPVYPNTFCEEVYGSKFDPKTMFCAGTLTTGDGACDHDAGGPAIMSGRLVGIISFGPTICGFPDSPTVFSDIGAFSNWIETVNETMPRNHIGDAKLTTTTESQLAKILADYEKSKRKRKHKGKVKVTRFRSHKTESGSSKAGKKDTSQQTSDFQQFLREIVNKNLSAVFETKTETETEKNELLLNTEVDTTTTTTTVWDPDAPRTSTVADEEWTAVI